MVDKYLSKIAAATNKVSFLYSFNSCKLNIFYIPYDLQYLLITFE